MGFDEGRIVLNNESNRYYAGQPIHGKLIFDQEKVKKFRGIFVRLRGFCSLHWVSKHTRRVNDRTETYTVTHESHEEYYLKKIFLVGSNEGEAHLQPGHYEFPFEFLLPADCPSSFESSHGHIRYELKACVDRAFKFDQEKFVQLEVFAPLDLNTVSIARNPIEMEFDQTYCCWCVSSGSSETLVKAPMSGFCPGQIVPLEVACNNTSSVEIDSITFTIKKKATFRATDHPDTKQEEETILEMRKGPVSANTNRNWVVEMTLPYMDVFNLTNCRFIDIDYELVVTVSPGGCHEDTQEIRPIIIGSVPLAESHGDMPTRDQIPNMSYPTVTAVYPPPPIVNQPLGNTPPMGYPYPSGNSPYPGGNQPYPGGNQPYPGGNPPYPGGNPPYPGGNSPFLGRNSPNPPANPPYPGQSPYPAGNTPNTAVNAPYPVVNSPYPPGNTPIPGNSPYPPGNTPLQGNSPYPPGNPSLPGNSPYPPENTHLPSGNSPSLGRTSPYPSNTPNVSSPYPVPSPYAVNTPGSLYNQTPPSANSSPYAKFTSNNVGTGLKTGSLGFVAAGLTSDVGKNGVSMPLLPPGAAVPNATSPYSTASAPETTPDHEVNPLVTNEVTDKIPPYNPEFLNKN